MQYRIAAVAGLVAGAAAFAIPAASVRPVPATEVQMRVTVHPPIGDSGSAIVRGWFTPTMGRLETESVTLGRAGRGGFAGPMLGRGGVIVMPDAQRMVAIDTVRREYLDEDPTALLTQIASLAAGDSSISRVRVHLDSSKTERILGHAARLYILEATFVIRRGTREMRGRLMIDSWQARLPVRMRTPYSGLVPAGGEASGSELVRRIAEAQRKIPGTTLRSRVVASVELQGGGMAPPIAVVTTMDVTSMRSVTVDDSRFAIPAGYTPRRAR